MGQNTFKALMNRGCDSETANRLEKAGHTLNYLKTLDVNELHDLSIPQELIDIILQEERPPIPRTTMNKVLFESRYTCCVCRDRSQGIIVHHIHKYSESRNHAEDNLVVLCLQHHGDAHTTRGLQLNLTPERLRESKQKWLDLVKQFDNHEALSANPEYSYQSINQIVDSVPLITAPVISCSASKTHIVWYNMIIFRKSQCLLKTSSVLRQRKLCNKH